jgi:3-dehydroquinate synthase II
MKEFWVDLRPFDKDLATTAIESGADTLVVDSAADVSVLSRIRTVAADGDLHEGKDVFFTLIRDKGSEQEALRHGGTGYSVVEATDWTVIPLENLVSQSDRIIAVVRNIEEAATALSVLEKGTAGVLLSTRDPSVIRAVGSLLRSRTERADLVPFKVTRIRQLGMGDRVCIDTCTLMKDGEGMLVGNTSSAFFLVHAETLENPYVAPRPFRVNAGAVHAYILLPGGKTAYLSDLSIGDPVLVTRSSGEAEEAIIGRTKAEKRPLLLVEAEHEGKKASLVLQNAETIRLVREDGSPVSVVALMKGDSILGALLEGGRHFGVAVRETIREK